MAVALTQVITEDRASGGQVIDGSLKSSSDNDRLYFTPSSTGNRKTWTWSGWIKRSELTSEQHFFQSWNGSGNVLLYMRFDSNDTMRIKQFSGVDDLECRTNAVFRDTSAWYHVVMVMDTTQAVSSDRTKIYVNGELQSLLTASYPAQNLNTFVNLSGYPHELFRNSYNSSISFNGHMSQVYLVDGQALDPSYFGFTDPLTNTWRPKKVTLKKSNAAGFSGSFASPHQGFDGDETTYVSNTTNGQTVYWTGNIPCTGTVRMRVSYGGAAGGSNLWLVNGNDVTSKIAALGGNATGYIDITTEAGSAITSMQWTDTAGVLDGSFGGFEVNGSLVTDVGTCGFNGFYLPLDGNSLIGEDKSGNGNDFTPVGFGNLNTIEKATGALPILNTVNGGNVAVPGVFGSKVSKTLTTTASTNTSNGFVFANEGTKPTLSFIRGATYTFDYSASTAHPLRFATAADAAGSTEYTDGTDTSVANTVKITVPHNAPDTLYYYCTNHGGMGNTISVTTDEKVADPYAWKNVLALPLVGSAADESNKINVESTTKTATVGGSVAASTVESNFYGTSYKFVGSDSIHYGTSADFEFTGDFTIECWAYATATGAQSLFVQTTTSGYFALNIDCNTGFDIYLDDYGTGYTVSKPFTNRWNHVAMVRSGSTITIYLNGVAGTTITNSNTLGSTSSNFSVGGLGTQSSGSYTGYMSDFRIYKGVAKYTSNFIPASTNSDILPDTPSGVAGGSALTKITDGAVSFNGDDLLTIPETASDEFTFGTGDWTIDGFVYFPVISNTYNTLVTTAHPTNNQGIWFGTNNSGVWWANTAPAGSGWLGGSTGVTASARRWYHFAYVRNSGVVKVYIDGVEIYSRSDSSDLSNTNNQITIGGRPNSSQFSTSILSNVRVVKGTALYTSNFTPPSTPLTNVTNTKLLCCTSPTSTTAAAVSPGSITAPSYGYNFKYAKIYSVYGGGLRSANYTIQYSDNNSTWTNAWSGVMSNNSSCGLQQGSGSGSQGSRRYWRYVEGSAVVTHHPRISRIVLSDGVNDVTIATYASDNCSDTGEYQIGTTTAYEDTTWTANVAGDNNPSATTFNPFTTDIDAVRGQESGYATLNPLDKNGGTLSDGNLFITSASTSNVNATLGISSGKWYWECIITGSASGGVIGIGAGSAMAGTALSNLSKIYGWSPNGSKYQNTTQLSYAGTYGVGDIIGVSFDADTRQLTFYKNGLSQGVAFTVDSGYEYKPQIHLNGMNVACNFGQKPFKYNPPEGFKTLCLANLPRPTKVALQPDKYFKVITTATDPRPNPPQVGDFIEGGYYAGRILHTDNKVYDIIVSPKASGQSVKQWKTSNDSSSSSTSRTYGKIAQDANNNANHPAFQWAAGLNINGYTDWYIPAQDELNVCYRAFKPTTGTNYTTNDNTMGANESALPFGRAFADDGGPSQTGISSFQSGGSEHFTVDGTNPAGQSASYAAHWSATEPSNLTSSAIRTAFGNGLATPAGDVAGGKTNSFLVRAIRRRYAYDGDVLNMLRNDIPDGLYWMKRRLYNNVRVDPAESWKVVDSVRGFTNNLACDSTAVENTYSASLSESVAYAWKAGGAAVSNTDGSITSSVSANQDAGFSIVSYTGTGIQGSTIGHGLGVAPKLIIAKVRSATGSWVVYHASEGAGKYGYLDTTGAFGSSNNFWGNGASAVAPTSSVFTIGSNARLNSNTQTFIAYCFAEVEGYSKFGVYTGNGNADGPFVYCGFRPALVMGKRTDTANWWYMIDSARDSENVVENIVAANADTQEYAYTNEKYDFLSNGFKLRQNGVGANASGGTYIFAAFAEAPTQNLFGGQANAR